MRDRELRPPPVIGQYDAPLWDAAASGELRLQRCEHCGQVRYIPTSHCPGCLSGSFQWALMSGRGRVASWCVFHKQYFPEMPPPYCVVLVDIDEGVIVAANLADGDTAGLKVGASVEAIFCPVRWTDGTAGKILKWRLI
jgi:uncharacterized OB-fold protein